MAKSPAATPSSNAPPPPIVTVVVPAVPSPSTTTPTTPSRYRQWLEATACPAAAADMRHRGRDAHCAHAGHDYDDVEIGLRSIEHTLLPLVKQVPLPHCTFVTARVPYPDITTPVPAAAHVYAAGNQRRRRRRPIIVASPLS